MTALKLRIQDDMKSAMKAKDQKRLSAIRLILAAIKQIEVDQRCEMTDDKVFSVLDKMLSQRKESIAQYSTANRQDLIDQEQFEIDLIQTYLPSPLTEAEIESLVNQAFKETGATTVKQMREVVDYLKPLCVGRADMGKISQLVKSRLN